MSALPLPRDARANFAARQRLGPVLDELAREGVSLEEEDVAAAIAAVIENVIRREEAFEATVRRVALDAGFADWIATATCERWSRALAPLELGDEQVLALLVATQRKE